MEYCVNTRGEEVTLQVHVRIFPRSARYAIRLVIAGQALMIAPASELSCQLRLFPTMAQAKKLNRNCFSFIRNFTYNSCRSRTLSGFHSSHIQVFLLSLLRAQAQAKQELVLFIDRRAAGPLFLNTHLSWPRRSLSCASIWT